MLQLLRNKGEQIDAQKKLVARAKSFLSLTETRTVAWRPSAAELRINHNGHLYFSSKKMETEATGERYWNVFGLYEPQGHLRIAVQINIAPNNHNALIAGFLAKDTDSGEVFLMHSGKIGGGAKGVGKDTFLGWASEAEITVFDETGKNSRTGFIIASIDSDETGPALARFALKVAEFREVVRSGYLNSPEYRQTKRDNDEYRREHSGRKSGTRNSEFDYITRHGDVVHALRAIRVANKTSSEIVPNSRLIDLYVKRGTTLTEVYEVKTSTSRQALYCAIGQLLVHRAQNLTTKLHVVLPKNELLPPDIARTLSELKVTKVDFTLHPLRVEIHPW